MANEHKSDKADQDAAKSNPGNPANPKPGSAPKPEHKGDAAQSAKEQPARS